MLIHFSGRSGVFMEDILGAGTALAPPQSPKHFHFLFVKYYTVSYNPRMMFK